MLDNKEKWILYGVGGTFVVKNIKTLIIVAGGGSYAINTMTINRYNSFGQSRVTITLQ